MKGMIEIGGWDGKALLYVGNGRKLEPHCDYCGNQVNTGEVAVYDGLGFTHLAHHADPLDTHSWTRYGLALWERRPGNGPRGDWA